MKEYKKNYYKKHRAAVIARSKARYEAMEPAARKRMARNHSLKIEYGFTIEVYEKMLSEQGGVCFLCKQPPRRVPLHVDHCHSTDRIRKLLCISCNTFLGRIEKDPTWLDRVKEYLQVHSQKAAA
jgi:hypothetical protein